MNTHFSSIALNAADQPGTGERPVASNALALNFEWPTEAEIPDWIELIPPGPLVQGKDGRQWINDQPDRVVANTKLPIPLDWEHATEKKAPNGEWAPAAGWIEALQVREGGAVWGRCEWTGNGKSSVSNREYRYISPAFRFERDTLRILQLLNAALTNRNNLDVTALNHLEAETQRGHAMNEEILKALGLPKDATDAQVLDAVNTLQTERQTALNAAQTPPLERFVPRADYEAQKDLALNAQKDLDEIKTASRQAEIDAEIAKALEAKKITPATKDYHVAMCRTEGGLEQFRAFVKGAPEIAADDLVKGTPGAEGQHGLTPEQVAVCSAMNLAPDEFRKTLGTPQTPATHQEA